MLRGNFYPSQLGSWVRPWFYQRTKELVSATTKLFVNDYNNIEGVDTVLYYKQIQDLKDRGAPIDAIGCQGHFPGLVDPVDVFEKLDILSSLGMPIQITEFDIVVGDVNLRADNLEYLFRTGFSHPAVEAIIMWGFWAGSHWRGANASIVDDDFTVNTAGLRFQSLMQQWTTNTWANSNSSGQAAFRVFHGNYTLSVPLPGGLVITKPFQILSGQDTINLTIDVSEGAIPPTTQTSATRRGTDTNPQTRARESSMSISSTDTSDASAIILCSWLLLVPFYF